MRKHGLTPPFNAMQIGTWILLPVLLAQFILFLTPVIGTVVASVIVTFFFVFFGVLTGYYGYVTTVTDPIDPMLKHYLFLKSSQRQVNTTAGMFSRGGSRSSVEVEEENPAMNEVDLEQDRSKTPIWLSLALRTFGLAMTRPLPPVSSTRSVEEEEETKFCWVCQTRVHTKSMHCKFCDKCVFNFDHHCQWLNTCIGDRNYPFFFATIVTSCLMLYLHVIVSVVLIATYFTADKGEENIVSSWWFYHPPETQAEAMGVDTMGTTVSDTSSNSAKVWLSFVIIFLAFNLVVSILITQLFCFHVQLLRKNLTTYEFIVQDNAKRRESERYKIDLDNRRRFERQRARENKNFCYEWRLVCGAALGSVCPACDPLRSAQQQEQQQQQQQSHNQHRSSKSSSPTTAAAAASSNSNKKKESKQNTKINSTSTTNTSPPSPSTNKTTANDDEECAPSSTTTSSNNNHTHNPSNGTTITKKQQLKHDSTPLTEPESYHDNNDLSKMDVGVLKTKPMDNGIVMT